MNVTKQVFPAVAMTVVLALFLGFVYPFFITGMAQMIFKQKALGSLVQKDGQVIGSSLIGQPFNGPGYFHSRPSSAGAGYDATASGGTNYGPTSKQLLEGNIKAATIQLCLENPDAAIPVDLVTSSASGLDPHISPAAAEFQVRRVARERGMTDDEVRRLVQQHTAGRQFGILGEPRVNVLEMNLVLDRIHAVAHSSVH